MTVSRGCVIKLYFNVSDPDENGSVKNVGYGVGVQNLHGNKACYTSNGKCAHSTQLLSRRDVSFRKLLQCCIGRESSRRICSLSCRCRDKTLKETANTSFLEDHLATVQEATHARIGRFSVIDAEERFRCQLRHLQGTKGPFSRSTDSCVFMLSNGVTARSDSVNPAPNPAMTVRGPETLPFSS